MTDDEAREAARSRFKATTGVTGGEYMRQGFDETWSAARERGKGLVAGEEELDAGQEKP